MKFTQQSVPQTIPQTFEEKKFNSLNVCTFILPKITLFLTDCDRIKPFDEPKKHCQKDDY